MASRKPPTPAATPILQGVRTGLLRAADQIQPEPGFEVDSGGVTYQPNTADPGQAFDLCTPLDEIEYPDEGAVSWEAWGQEASSQCFTGSTTQAEQEARALQRYNAQISHMVESTFWTGELPLGGDSFAGAGMPNRPLASSLATNLTGSAAVGIVTGFNFAIEYLADTVGGLRGMIHVPYKLLPYLSFYNTVIRDGFNLFTSLADHIVVAGTGYNGNGPGNVPAAGGRTWIYVTTPVRAFASQPNVRSALDRTGNLNRWGAIAFGIALAEWDLQAHAAIQVCIPDPGPECTVGAS